MSKNRTIQINIHEPCSQNLDEMAVTPNGRFCSHCEKNVIDFSTWSDTALYNFFAKNTAHVCGRLSPAQLERPINIPYQPHSKLYRITIALGLTLLCSQTPQLLAQNRPPKTEQTSILKQTQPTGTQFGYLAGRILDDKKQYAVGVLIQAYEGLNLRANDTTDQDGNYRIDGLETGYYDLVAISDGYKETRITNIVVIADNRTTVNINLIPRGDNDTASVISTYRKPLMTGDVSVSSRILNNNEFQPLELRQLRTGDTQVIKDLDTDNPTKRTLTRDEINNMPR